MATHVGVQRLLLGPEGVEQLQRTLPLVSLVVPLQQDVQRNGDAPGLVERDGGYETPREEAGRRNAGLGHDEPDTDRYDSPGVRSRAADVRQRQQRIQSRLPFRNRLFDQGRTSRSMISSTGSPAASASCRSARARSTSGHRGRSPLPGSSMVAAAKPYAAYRGRVRPAAGTSCPARPGGRAGSAGPVRTVTRASTADPESR